MLGQLKQIFIRLQNWPTDYTRPGRTRVYATFDLFIAISQSKLQRLMLALQYLMLFYNTIIFRCYILLFTCNCLIFVAICNFILQPTSAQVATLSHCCNIPTYCIHRRNSLQYIRRTHNKNICVAIFGTYCNHQNLYRNTTHLVAKGAPIATKVNICRKNHT